MALSESILVAIFCLSVVFAVLACLFAIIRLFSALIGAFATQKTGSAVTATPVLESMDNNAVSPQENEVFSSGHLKLRDVDEPTAAMIMAIVSDESGIPLSELCFKSIRLIKK